MYGEAVKLPKSSPYKKYIQWLREQDKEQAEQFWRGKLKGFTAPTLLGLESKEKKKVTQRRLRIYQKSRLKRYKDGRNAINLL